MVGSKSPNPIDKHVGARVRMRRLMVEMSQETLGSKLGLTFQQVQKYEKGTNRISASRLQHLAEILQVPVAFFFEGAVQPESKTLEEPNAISSPDVMNFLSTTDGLALAGAFMRLKNAKLRHSIVRLVEDVAEP